MREWGKVSSDFWSKGSGKRLRGEHLAQVVALHLVTCRWSNSLGVFYMPLASLASEIGSPLQGALEGLSIVTDAGFAFYDQAAELVWVPNHAEIEVGRELKGGDKRRPYIQAELDSLGNHPFAAAFWEKYGDAYKLTKPKALASPFEGALNLVRSPSEAKAIAKQDQNKNTGIVVEPMQSELALTAAPSAPAVVEKTPRKERTQEQRDRSVAVNRRYRERYEISEGHPPTGMDQQANGIIARFSDKHADNAIAILDWFFDCPDTGFKRAGWPLQLLFDQAPKLWRELNDKRKAAENLAAPTQQRIIARNASNDIELERANAILAREMNQ